MAFKVDRVEDLDRMAIRESVIERFSAERMTDGYEAIYARMLSDEAGAPASHEEDAIMEPAAGDAVIPAERLSSRRADRLGSVSGRS